MKAPLLAATVAGALLLTAAPADAAPTGNIHTAQQTTQDSNAVHGFVWWSTDKNLGDITVGAQLQRYTSHAWGLWHSWDPRGREAGQETSTGTHGYLTVWSYCQTGQWRTHVDTLVVVIEGHGVTVVPVHRTHNSHKIIVRHC